MEMGATTYLLVLTGVCCVKVSFSSALKGKVSSTARAQASTHHIMSLSCQFREGQPKNLQLQPMNTERGRGF